MSFRLYSFIFLLNISLGFGQIKQGTLNVTGYPNFKQTLNEVVTEPGVDDNLGVETNMNTSMLSFTLDESSGTILGGGIVSSLVNCSNHIFRYKVFMHRSSHPEYDNMVVMARVTGEGARFPSSIPYDNLPGGILGPRNLTPANNGQYIAIPDSPFRATKIMEFIGCWRDIPIQYKILPSAKSPVNPPDFEIFFTVVGSVL
ncbi:hypothetical protein HCG49_10570 [Arenibacter sp. 6A1]|uniref:hypothetical protein n=1 Tax=Arenibacter sp. 6A1 TaxID=2720391 RepID=UPI001445911E|nr:hypothetical protein [Arenibacter sp. 6A1]NKI27005.1 hypothetical protein [Arenibacter sp. 6A1]